MNKEEQKELLKAFKEYSRKITASKTESENFLKRAGIHKEDGSLTKRYAHS